MHDAPAPKGAQRHAVNSPTLVPLEDETRAALPTSEAARHLNRAEQTLRIWSFSERGPIRPLRINGRLAWRVVDIRRLLDGGAS